MAALLQYWWMLPLGFAIGVLGTLVGAGGGFLLVPILLFIYPKQDPQMITSISLAVVCANAASGSISYARMRRIDYRSGLLFAAAGVPGAVLGAMTTEWIPRRLFDGLFGAVLLILSIVLIRRADGGPAANASHTKDGVPNQIGKYPMRRGLLISAAVGFLSSVLGVGGGIMHVPAMVYLLDFPVHIATATSHFVLAIMAAVGTIVHIATGAFHAGVRRTIMLSVGVVIGAPIGAALSRRLSPKWIVRGLGVSLVLVGIRLILLALFGTP